MTVGMLILIISIILIVTVYLICGTICWGFLEAIKYGIVIITILFLGCVFIFVFIALPAIIGSTWNTPLIKG